MSTTKFMLPDPAEQDLASQLQIRFHLYYGVEPRLFRAPGRVNLIGEHTDYNDGFVMPVALNYYAWVAISPRDDQKLVVYSENLAELAEIPLGDPDPRPAGRWSDYVNGVALFLRSRGCILRGANLLIHSEVPLGSGLSSSAALEVAVAAALLGVAEQQMELIEMAKTCQQAENNFVGARCGIMDQFTACCARPAYGLLLDCRSLAYRHLPLPKAASLVISNTMVKHELARGEYNTRRAQCEEAVQLLVPDRAGIRALRDIDLAFLEQEKHRLPEVVYRRCRHVVSENLRVEQAADALESGNLEQLGRLMNDSHRSLRDDFEVSCTELNLMVDLATAIDGVYGSRMTGGGFGGCTISLVRSDSVEQFRSEVTAGYERATKLRPDIYVPQAAGGVTEIAV